MDFLNFTSKFLQYLFVLRVKVLPSSVDFLKRGQISFTFENRVFQSWMSEILLNRTSTYFGVFSFNLLRTTAHRFIRASSLNWIHPKKLNNFTEEVLGDTPRIILAALFVI